MSTADQVLDAIDSALHDWSAGPDAMRSAPERAAEADNDGIPDWLPAGISFWPDIFWPDVAAGFDVGGFTGFLQYEPRDIPGQYPWSFESDHSHVATWFSLDTDPLLLGYSDGSHFRPGTLPDPEPGTIGALANERVKRLLDAAAPSRHELRLEAAPVRHLALPHPVEVSVALPLDEHHARLAAEFARANGSASR